MSKYFINKWLNEIYYIEIHDENLWVIYLKLFINILLYTIIEKCLKLKLKNNKI